MRSVPTRRGRSDQKPELLMSDSRMERQLLLGIIAMQNGFVSQDDFLAAFRIWSEDRTQPFATVLTQQKFVDQKIAELLESLVEAHIRVHHGRTDDSLSSMTGLPEQLQVELQSMSGADLRDSLSSIGAGGMSLTLAMGEATNSGRFRILRPHRKGGLGEVFVARDEELDREVALKQIRTVRPGDTIQRDRFLREAEITGKLEHPGVVPVYGLGHDDNGAPYYAMRLIRGRSLKDAVEEFHSGDESVAGTPTLQNREFRRLLGWLIDVCNAVDYAHSRGVLHRDLKPANIMLGRYGETLVVDWGLARVNGADEPAGTARHEPPVLSNLSGTSSETVAGTAMGTPAFMSPEQAEGRLDLLGPRSDVYSLGATLFTILTGQPSLEGEAADVIRRVVAGDVRAPQSLNSKIPSALDAVCRKAMAYRPEDRYDSPGSMASDIEAWLADEPVSAWSEPATARLRRWGRRHQAEMATIVGAVLLLAVSSGVWAWMLRDSNRELLTASSTVQQQNEELAAANEQSRLDRERADNVRDYLVSTFQLSNPAENGSLLTAAEVLDQALLEMDDRLAGDNEARADLLAAVGTSYRGLGLYRRALEVFQKEHALRTELHEPTDPKLLRAAYNVALATQHNGDYETALALHEENLKQQTTALGEDHPQTLNSLGALSISLRSVGRHDEALEINKDLLRKRQQLHGDDSSETMMAVNNLATALQGKGQFDEALRLFTENYTNRRRVEGDEHRNTLLAMDRLASIHNAMGHFDESVPLYEQAYEKRRRKFGDDHPDTLESLSGLGFACRDAGQVDRAVEILQRARDEKGKRFGANHPVAIAAINDLARVYLSQGLYREALPLVKDACHRTQTALGEENPKTLAARNTLGMTLFRLGQFSEAVSVYESLRDVYLREYGEDHPTTLSIVNNLAMSYRDAGRVLDSVPLFRVTLESRRSQLGAEHPKTLVSMQNLAAILRMSGQLQEASLLAEESARLHLKVLGATHRQSISALSIRDQSLMDLGRYRDALVNAQKTLMHATAGPGENHPDTLKATDVVGRIYLKCGESEKAQQLFQSVLETRRQTLGEEHPSTLISELNLARCARERGAEDAVARCRSAWEKLTSHYGEKHRTSLNAAREYFQALSEQDAASSIEGLRTTLDAQRALQGDLHPNPQQTRFILATVLHGDGQMDLARQIIADVHSQRSRILGVLHPDTLAAELSQIVWNMSSIEPQQCEQRLTDLWQRRPGKDTPRYPAEIAFEREIAAAFIQLGNSTGNDELITHWTTIAERASE